MIYLFLNYTYQWENCFETKRKSKDNEFWAMKDKSDLLLRLSHQFIINNNQVLLIVRCVSEFPLVKVWLGIAQFLIFLSSDKYRKHWLIEQNKWIILS